MQIDRELKLCSFLISPLVFQAEEQKRQTLPYLLTLLEIALYLCFF